MSQRIRLLRAMTDEVAAKGFADTTAAAVYTRAGVSSRAFYENFTDVRDCFLASYDSCSAAASSALRGVSGASALERFDGLLETYLRLLAHEPSMARTFLLEVYAAGPQALQRRVAVHDQFVSLVCQVLAGGRRLPRADRVSVEALVNAVTFAVTVRLAAGDLGDISVLRGDLLVAAGRLCPWLEE